MNGDALGEAFGDQVGANPRDPTGRTDACYRGWRLIGETHPGERTSYPVQRNNQTL
ncbi:hypothetical protein [Goodfellowiella coeruleoviolacea]|uniref:hypothetical protein n=1 Tax=Goodfellowiella coeruleoviolacea TaxID=334858 RepID=UPI0020A2D28A|nr:hypothetical protein [Goodfellowiella coeruleoviolacea]